MPILGLYECKASHCLLRFQTKDELMSHIKKKHVVWTQKYENFCQECKILFKSDEDLKRHYQQDHPDKNTGASMIIDRDLVDHDQEIVQKLMLENPHCKAFFRRKKSNVASEIAQIKVEIEPEVTAEEKNDTNFDIKKTLLCDFTENLMDENVEIKEEIFSDDDEEINKIAFGADP